MYMKEVEGFCVVSYEVNSVTGRYADTGELL